jgi:hypothetical protein
MASRTLVAIAALQPAPMQPPAEQLGMDRTTLTAMLRLGVGAGWCPSASTSRTVAVAATLTDRVAPARRSHSALEKVQHEVGRDVGASTAPALEHTWRTGLTFFRIHVDINL